jgi:hypothetical protein
MLKNKAHNPNALVNNFITLSGDSMDSWHLHTLPFIRQSKRP